MVLNPGVQIAAPHGGVRRLGPDDLGAIQGTMIMTVGRESLENLEYFLSWPGLPPSNIAFKPSRGAGEQ